MLQTSTTTVSISITLYYRGKRHGDKIIAKKLRLLSRVTNVIMFLVGVVPIVQNVYQFDLDMHKPQESLPVVETK